MGSLTGENRSANYFDFGSSGLQYGPISGRGNGGAHKSRRKTARRRGTVPTGQGRILKMRIRPCPSASFQAG